MASNSLKINKHFPEFRFLISNSTVRTKISDTIIKTSFAIFLVAGETSEPIGRIHISKDLSRFVSWNTAVNSLNLNS